MLPVDNTNLKKNFCCSSSSPPAKQKSLGINKTQLASNKRWVPAPNRYSSPLSQFSSTPSPSPSSSLDSQSPLQHLSSPEPQDPTPIPTCFQQQPTCSPLQSSPENSASEQFKSLNVLFKNLDVSETPPRSPRTKSEAETDEAETESEDDDDELILQPHTLNNVNKKEEELCTRISNALKAGAQCINLERGAYVLKDPNNKPIIVFKPNDEARGGPHAKNNKRTITKGMQCQILSAHLGIPYQLEGANEIIAAGLFKQGYAVVEMNMNGNFYNSAMKDYVRCQKRGVAIEFIPFACEATPSDNYACATDPSINPTLIPDSSSLQSIQNVMIMSLALCDSDCNYGNILVRKIPDDSLKFYKIDNALILSARFQSPGLFAWTDWPCAKMKFTDNSKAQIAELDADRSIEQIQEIYPNYPAENLQTLKISYHILKTAVSIGLRPYQIANIFSRANIIQNIYIQIQKHPKMMYEIITKTLIRENNKSQHAETKMAPIPE